MSQQHDCKSTIERAFEIAESGDAATMERLGRMLSGEGYSMNMLTGPLLMKQLRQKIAAVQRARTAG